jgi:hypothetical protein
MLAFIKMPENIFCISLCCCVEMGGSQKRIMNSLVALPAGLGSGIHLPPRVITFCRVSATGVAEDKTAKY